ncbi:MAG: exopolysaccharide transport family protein [Mesorhizobium sp.]|nr:exopolysaccharide transport family protein [Mesorhizobium sp.]
MQGTNPNVSDVDVDLARLWRAIVGSWKIIVAVALIAAFAGLAFSMLAAPHYKAATRILIETRESVYTRPGQTAEADRPILDEEGVTSQVELVSSSDILRTVVRDLDLVNNEEFAPSRSPLRSLFAMFGLASNPSDQSIEQRVIGAVREQLTVYRVERSRVIVIEFSSRQPALAAAVPNAIADAYLGIQQEAKLVANADATDWLAPEIEQLREQVRVAEERAAEFRSGSNLFLGQNNATLASQQLSELSTELSRVRAERSAAVAKAGEVRAVLENGGSIEAMPEVVSSPLVQRLVERRVQINTEIADLSTTLLENHPRIRSLRSQLSDLDRQIREEGRKVLQALEREGASAERREQELTAELNQLKAASTQANEQEVELRALEREATAQRELLESYLTRHREASSRFERNYLPVDARVFARAMPPAEPYFPKPVPIVGASFAGALMLAMLAILLRELFSGRALAAAPGRTFDRVEDVVMTPATASDNDLEPEAMPAEGAGLSVAMAARLLAANEVTRAAFISPEGDEGVAASVMVAREASDSGLRVVFLDLTRSGVATFAMLEDASLPGVTNLLCSEAQFSEVIHADRYSECHIIPTGTADVAKAMRAIDRLPIILSSLETAYDLVVVECGQANASGIKRVAGAGTVVMLGATEPEDEHVQAATRDLEAGGFDEVLVVTPAEALPAAPRGRRAA